MSKPTESNASISTIPYRYDLGVARDCSVSYFVDNGLRQSFLGVQNSGTANHQGLGVNDANAGVGSEYGSDVLP